MTSIIAYLFYTLLFLTPLAMNTYTSEIFEFNKMIVLYFGVVLIITAWAVRMITEKRVILRRTLLDIPLLLFLGSLGISTILSIDFRTSLLGYYSRFNGGFVSILCYALLYWAWVSNMSRRHSLYALRFTLFAALPVCLYGIAQHFGIDKDVWVQDVQNRIFSTLGQPNWLAAWICAIIPITWALSLRDLYCHSHAGGNQISKAFDFVYNNKTVWNHKHLSFNWILAYARMTMYIILSCLLFITLLFTKSRSGLLAFGIESIIFWSMIVIANIRNKYVNLSSFLKQLCILNFAFLIIAVVIGTPWTPSISQIFNKENLVPSALSLVPGTQLESGGTESGEIRKIVWRGAFDIFKSYPIFGTGVETFAFAYYQFKPEEHNYTSEWDYLYNKAHNEYLNYLATTGLVGLTSYLIVIVFILYQFKIQSAKLKVTVQNSKSDSSDKLSTFNCNFELRTLNFALVSGFISILITNFFGFSVVPVSLLFFLFPAMAKTLVISDKRQEIRKVKKISAFQLLGIFILLLISFILSLSLFNYYSADLSYSSGRQANRTKDVITAQKKLIEATEKSPNESIYWDELALSNKQIAIALSESKQVEKGKKYAQDAITDSKTAIELSPRNINLKRNYAATLTALSSYDQRYLQEALDVLKNSIQYAPTDPKLQYALAASYYRLGQLDQAIIEMKKAVDMKKDYKDTHYALALMYEDKKDEEKAKEEFKYILKKIDANDEQVKKELEELK
jgi:putative inorganic carbon (hco3(-)) transporter